MTTHLALWLFFLVTMVVVFERAINGSNHQPSLDRTLFVSSLSLPRLHQKLIISVECHHDLPKTCNGDLSYGYTVVDRCPVRTIVAQNNEGKAYGMDRKDCNSNDEKDLNHELNIVDALLKWNPNGRFPSKTQAKRSLEHGKVLLFNTTVSTTDVTNVETSARKDAIKHKKDENLKEIHISLRDLQPHIGSINSVLEPHTIFVVVESIPSFDRYSTTVTKYMFPPAKTVNLVPIVYEDNNLAVVNKPENMTTIGGSGSGRTDDLQSVLGFLLRPSAFDTSYHPRPVHRLDRRTSGLVLVAKTKSSMRTLSKAFATRTVTKTYSALVFERDRELSARLSASNDNILFSNTTKGWLVVDYPIESREAISEVRMVRASSSSYFSMDEEMENPSDAFSLVEVRPKTGRTHQIRRHLSYCLGMPIVGDSKYDKGARHLRTNGMYLCCHSLTFPHDNDNEENANNTYIFKEATIEWIDANSRGNGPTLETLKNSERQLSVCIPLPDKFSPCTNYRG